MAKTAPIGIPSTVDLTSYLPDFYAKKVNGDKKIAAGIIATGIPTFSHLTPDEAYQTVHVTVDTLIAEALQRTGMSPRDLMMEITFDIGGTDVMISEGNLEHRLLKGFKIRELEKHIKRAMRPEIEQFLQNVRFEGKKTFINALLKKVARTAARSLVDERIDPKSPESFRCHCRKAA